MLRDLGAAPVVADALDLDQVSAAVATAKPDVIVHQLTAIGSVNPRHMDRDFAMTNRLRTDSTDYLLSAGQAVGVKRFVAQSIAGFGAYARTGGARQERGGSARRRAPARHAQRARGRPPSRGCGPRGAVDRGHRAALRRLLRARYAAGARRRAVRVDPQAQVPPGRRWCGRVVLCSRRRRCRRRPSPRSSAGSRGVYNVVDDDPATVAEWLPVAGTDAGREEAAARATLRRPSRRRRGRCDDDDRGPWRFEREGPARTGVAPAPFQLAGGDVGMTDRERLLEELRPGAFAIAYRMLGSVTEAEDVVQEALVRVRPGARRGRGDRVASGVRLDRDHAPRHQRAPFGAGASRTLLSANGCPSPSSPTARTIRRSTPRPPIRCRWRCWCCWNRCPPSNERCCCCATSSTMTTGRSRRSSARARTTRASSRRARGVIVADRRPRFRTHAQAARRAGPQASSRRLSTAISRRWKPSSLTMSS